MEYEIDDLPMDDSDGSDHADYSGIRHSPLRESYGDADPRDYPGEQDRAMHIPEQEDG